MNKGPIAAILLIFGFILRFGAIFLRASEQFDDSSPALPIGVVGILLWMAGSFVLAAHLRLQPAWGWAGLLFIVGIYLMFRAASKNSRRNTTDTQTEAEERKANTYDY